MLKNFLDFENVFVYNSSWYLEKPKKLKIAKPKKLKTATQKVQAVRGTSYEL